MFKKYINQRTKHKSKFSNNSFDFSNLNKMENLLFIHLDLYLFKTVKCLNNCIDKKICFNYHNYKDKRRSPFKKHYDIKLCKDYKNCKFKDNCSWAHNTTEILYHPKFYKRKYCIDYFKNNKCMYKSYCSFAHNDFELRINILNNYFYNYNFFLFWFKTEFCPLGNMNHNKNFCAYSHNFQDYKRKKINNIVPIICKNWDLKKTYTNYEDGCRFNFDCRFGHGWKELCYNPVIYKSKKCIYSKENCMFKNTCHYYHNEEEYIKYNKNKDKYFNIVPKNKNAKICNQNKINHTLLEFTIKNISKKKHSIKF